MYIVYAILAVTVVAVILSAVEEWLEGVKFFFPEPSYLDEDLEVDIAMNELDEWITTTLNKGMPPRPYDQDQDS